jgi:predicted  nucleic acid-binding Zn-ribbon protein
VSRLKRLLTRDADDRRPGALARVKLRRRLDRQERLREALLLDLGAIIFELHRQRRREPELLQAKAAELDAVDAEVRALALALDDGRGLPELTASGLVATCTACGSLMGSGERYCPHCGAAAGAVLPASDNGAPELDAAAGEEEDDARPAEAIGEGEARPDDEEEEAPEEHRTAALEEEQPVPAAQNGSSPNTQDELVRLAQSKLRAGRRVARRWLAQRRPETR